MKNYLVKGFGYINHSKMVEIIDDLYPADGNGETGIIGKTILATAFRKSKTDPNLYSETKNWRLLPTTILIKYCILFNEYIKKLI